MKLSERLAACASPETLAKVLQVLLEHVHDLHTDEVARRVDGENDLYAAGIERVQDLLAAQYATAARTREVRIEHSPGWQPRLPLERRRRPIRVRK